MLPGEFVDWLDAVTKALKLTAVLQNGREPREVWDGNHNAALCATRVFLAEPETVSPEALADDASPGRLGWVVCRVPRVEEDRLFAIQVGVRGDWLDTVTNTVDENKAALRQFERISKKLTPLLRSPVHARNLITAATASYSSMGCTKGASDWYKQGGKLLQEGVENIEFFIPEPEREKRN